MSVKHVTAATLILAVAACAPARQPVPEVRGSIVSTTPVADLQPADVTKSLQAAKFDPADVRYGVTAYRVLYRTIGTKGEPTTATQLVAFPKNEDSDLRPVSWLHGTTVYRADVASVKPESSDRAAAFLIASTGRAVSAPDYLGLGEGPGHHPYGHVEATISSTLDALRAMRELARQQGKTVDERVLISGFSQGAPATMMLGRALQEGADPYFTPAGLAPVGGPFQVSRFEADAAADKVARASLYLAYFAIAWDRVYDIYGSPRNVFREPYAAQVEALFDGSHTTQEIAKALPPRSQDLFTGEFLREVQNPTGKLRDLLRAADASCDWAPTVPVHIYHASGDRDIAFHHAEHCRSRLKTKGELTDVGDADHNGSVRRALPLILREFP
ncbi:lipase family protein [Allokutzneria albata]|uniref:Alpha/beta hydrolase family protein n=1 Tax=Allokutzneria albata TaxID=211114 RepID=A0A1H0BPF0_ALLAB|nr:lipase family protein [Allokutzneria albata]SDN47526.1 Alpha/beta hydrolase family protein [Allokutzneria albata]